jgi:hypothetical protein
MLREAVVVVRALRIKSGSVVLEAASGSRWVLTVLLRAQWDETVGQ